MAVIAICWFVLIFAICTIRKRDVQSLVHYDRLDNPTSRFKHNFSDPLYEIKIQRLLLPYWLLVFLHYLYTVIMFISI